MEYTEYTENLENTEQMEHLERLKNAYAKLLIREGVNVQPGQRLVITCPVEQAAFGRLCAAEAYAVGCGEVIFRWTDDSLTRMKYLYAADSVFDRVNPWETLLADSVSAEGAAWLAIRGEDPENLRGVRPDRIRRANAASGAAMRLFREREARNAFPWCVCAVPTVAWAKAVFPESGEDAVLRLWEEILGACRVTGEDAVACWQAHSAALQRHVEQLNALDLRYLRYHNGLGTDLEVELPEGCFWAGGQEKCITTGVPFSANIPTEEVFTLPRRDGVNGVVYASRPLVYQGTVIEGLRFVLRDGKITEVSAETGLEVLRDATQLDEGASHLGEVALVPWDSPICSSGVLFYETLFDENASCHFAFGDAYPCIRGAETMTQEQLKERGANASITHVDFMVGTPDLSITGVTRDGREVAVFRAGNFAF